MPFAVTHILVPIIFLELLRNNSPKISKFLSRKHTFLAGLAGIMPDIDVPLYTLLKYLGLTITMDPLIKRTLFENFLIVFSFLGFFLLFYYFLPKVKLFKKSSKSLEKNGKIFLVLFIAWSIHVLLDGILTGGSIPFYPLNDYIVDYNLVGRISQSTGINMITILVSMDAVLLFFWLWHEEAHQYIKDYF